MPPRSSVVGEVKINNVGFASTVFIGDNLHIRPRAHALAIRRDIPTFRDGEGDFADFPIFRRQLPPLPATGEPVRLRTVHAEPAIRVGAVRIISVSTAAVFQVGSTGMVESRDRIKHFRQLLALTPPGAFPTVPRLPDPS